MAKVPVNLTIEEDIIKAFKDAIERVGLSASGVVEVFMRGMLSDESPTRMERFVEIVRSMRKEIRGV